MPTAFSTLYVDIGQPFSSALLAFGVACIADALLHRQRGEARRISIRNAQSHYAIELEPAIDPSRVQPFFCPLRLIETAKNKDALPQSGERWDYEAEKAKVSRYFELRKTLTPAERSPSASPDQFPRLHELAANQPRPEWYGIAMINQMQALTAYNDVVATWLACAPVWEKLLALMLRFWSEPSNDIATALIEWQAIAKEHELTGKEAITASQTVNPEQGKGSNRAKADALTVGNQSSFWLLEAMKFIGVFEAAIPRTISGVKDRKTYVLLPKNIDLSTHRANYTRFQQVLWPSTAVKLDVMAALRYSKLFVEQWLEGQTGGLGLSFQPGNHVQGFATAFYKDLGSAVATMNMSTVNLPEWMPPFADAQGVQRLIEIFDEQLTIIQTLDESKGTEESLLRRYRDFLSSRDPQLTAFFEFTNAYAAHIMGKMVRRQYAPRISTTSLEVIIMTNDQQRTKSLATIIRTPGFQNIAEAIRRSTVIPQYQKNQGTRTYDVRYGLGDSLKRKARYPLQFIQELSDFMHLYNQENARVAEKQKMQFRKAITTEDIDQVAQLLDEYDDDAPAVAYLLIAYGYARDPKEREPKAEGRDRPDDTPEAGADDNLPDGDNLPF